MTNKYFYSFARAFIPFKYKDFVLKNEDFHGAAAQDEYLKNIEWQGLQGVPAYQKIITDTTQHVYNLLK